MGSLTPVKGSAIYRAPFEITLRYSGHESSIDTPGP